MRKRKSQDVNRLPPGSGAVGGLSWQWGVQAAAGGSANTDTETAGENPPCHPVFLPPGSTSKELFFWLFSNNTNASADALTTHPHPPPPPARPRPVIAGFRSVRFCSPTHVPLKGPSSCRGGSHGDSPEQQGLQTSVGHTFFRSLVCCLNATSSWCLSPASKATFFSLVLCRPLSHLCSRRLNIVGDEEVLIWLGREKQGRGGMFNWLPAERASTSGKRGGFLFPVSRCVTIFTSY